ncbi:retention module-containing protein [Pseudocitrobacter corydidari]
MSTVIGTIKAIIGQAWIVASDGTRRQATEGEQVMRGEQIVTEQGAVTVTLPNGKNLDLGRASHWGDDTTVTTSAESSPPQDLAAAQQAIAEGADPSQVLEATAAGNPVTSSATGEAGDGGEGHTHVVLDLTGQILDPTAGYPTDGIDATFPGPLEEETLLETDQDVNDTDDDPIITPEPPVPPVLPEASITIDAIAGDNIINMREAMQETTVVSGKTGHDVRPGDVVTVTVNGNHYQTTVQADGNWSVNVNTSDLLASGDVQASVTTRDDNGNEATASAQSSVGQAALSVEVEIDPIGGDGWINAEEAKAENTVISGTVGGDAKAGDVVNLEVNGNQYEAVVREDLTWSTEVKTSDLLADPEVNGSITIKDAAGNEATATDVESVQVDTEISVTLNIDTISDGWINAEEAEQLTTTVKGTVGGDAKAGDVVHLEVNGKPYEAIVQDDLTWSTEVKTADLLADPEVNGSITIRDEAGNEATATAVEPVKVDMDISVTLDIDVIAGDGWINAEEAKAENTTVSGTVGGDAKAGDVVHLEVNGNPYEAVVREDLTWSTEVKTSDLLADPEVVGTITIRDEAGNTAHASASTDVQLATGDLTVTITIEPVGDGALTAAEREELTDEDGNITLRGTVGGDAKAGDTVMVTVNGGEAQSATVSTLPDGSLGWELKVPASVIQEGGNHIEADIAIRDAAGNHAEASASTDVQLATGDLTVTITIEPVGDGALTAAEREELTDEDGNITLRGTVGGDAKAGDTVMVTVNGGEAQSATVSTLPDGSLGWELKVPASVIQEGGNHIEADIAIRDAAGNHAEASASTDVQLATGDLTVTITIEPVGDGALTAAEREELTDEDGNITLRGTVGGDAKAGDTVMVTVNGGEAQSATVSTLPDGSLGWELKVPASVIQEGGNHIEADIAIRDAAGNHAEANASTDVQLATGDLTVTITIEPVGDGALTAAEREELTDEDGNITLRGTVGGDAKAGDTVMVTVNGGEAQSATVSTLPDGSLGWELKVPASVIQEGGNHIEADIAIRDAAGNHAEASASTDVQLATGDLTVTITIEPVGDGALTAAEREELTDGDGNITLRGTVGGDAKAGDTVMVTVNGGEAQSATVSTLPDGSLGWELKVPASVIQEGGNHIEADIAIRDAAGNHAEASASTDVQLATGDLTVTITIEPVGDGALTAAEREELTDGDGNITLRGTVGGDAKAGDTVMVTVNGGEAQSATVSTLPDGSLGWELKVPASVIQEGGNHIEADIAIRDAAGNHAEANASTDVQLATDDLTVTITIEPVGDGALTAAEREELTDGDGNITLRGTVGGDAKAGDTVMVTVNGGEAQSATVSTLPDGSLGWELKVPASVIQEGGNHIEADIAIRDAAGNHAEANASTDVQLATGDLTVTITIEPVGDGALTAAEREELTDEDGNITLRGTVGGDAKAGDTVMVTVNGGEAQSATVSTLPDGSLGWELKVPASVIQEGGNHIEADIAIRDTAGNHAEANASTDVQLAAEGITVTVIIDPITGDDFLSFSETNQSPQSGAPEPTIKVTGHVEGNAVVGDVVTVMVGEVSKEVKVTVDTDGKLVWEAEFKASDFANNPNVTANITISDTAGNTASDDDARKVTFETGKVITGDEYDNIINGSDGNSDIVIADVEGLQPNPGQDYNIAFIVDTSGSVGDKDIAQIITQLTAVFNSLAASAAQDNSGAVNILLIDFDSQVNFSYSINLQEPNALSKLIEQLKTMESGGGTNYEDAFDAATTWFKQVESEGAENITYFITDGKPTYHINEVTQIDVNSSSSTNYLYINNINYKSGESYSMQVGSRTREVIDKEGNVYSYNNNNSTPTLIGRVVSDGKGGYVIRQIAGNGSSTSDDTLQQSSAAFLLLAFACDNVEAIGIKNGINADDLRPYDTDGNVLANINSNDLAAAILGKDSSVMEGAQDTVHGRAGNDILFGDIVEFADINGNGYNAMAAYVAEKLGVSVSSINSSHVHQYVIEHPEEFDMSRDDGGKDVLFGGQGDDILYGGGGDDILVGGSGDDVLFGGKGDDILIGDGFDSSAELASHMGTTVGDLTFDKVADYVVQNSDELGAMGTGNDILHGGEGHDILIGGGGHDILNGGLGDDILYGGTGNDVLTGGKGDDTLIGGSGSDTFTWLKGDDGHDVIKDFDASQGDRIDLSELLGDNIDNLADYIKVSDDGKGGALIEINTDGQMSNGGATMSITIENHSASDINSLLADPAQTSIII